MKETIQASPKIKSENFEDLLNRRKLAKNFLDVVISQTANVYSINAPWGTGKTWFLKFIEDECQNQNIPFIQFNVWETDYAKDPFQAILSELVKLLHIQIKNINAKNEIENLEKELASIKSKANKFLNLRKKLSYSIGLNHPTLPVSGEITVNPDTSSLAEYEDMKTTKNDFINSLKNFVNSFETKLLIAIDELDRCRPDYAITTLEIIKHFFNIKNVVFILAVDKEQLQATVKTMFGSSTDTDAYLKKFVDIQYCLPESSSISQFIRYQIKNVYPTIQKNFNELLAYNLAEYDNGDWHCTQVKEEDYTNKFINLCISYSLSLRDIEKLCLRMSIVLPMITKNKLPFSLTFLVVLILLNTKYYETYLRFKNIEVLADNADFSGMLYWKVNEFRNTYKKIHRILSYKMNNRYNHSDCQLAKNLIEYFNLIDFAKDFNNT